MKSLKTSCRLLCLLAASGCVLAKAAAIDLVVPAYFYPSWIPSQNEWNTMRSSLASGAQITAIMNPGNGPGTAVNSDYASAVNAFQSAGGIVLGYDYTCYGVNHCSSEVPPTRSIASIEADANTYANGYHVNGVFLDEMASNSATLPFYQTLSKDLTKAHPSWQIVGNPGTTPQTNAYYGAASSLVVFEGSYSNFVSNTSFAHLSNPGQSIAFVHDASTAAEMETAMALAKKYGLAGIYVTDGTEASNNPYRDLPSYWNAEVAASLSPVPEAPISLTFALGLGILAFARMRSRMTAGPARS
jgi:hypothetical protein